MGINDTRKCIKEERINYNSHAASKTFFMDLKLLDKFFKGAILENLTIFRDENNTENVKKKIRKNEVF